MIDYPARPHVGSRFVDMGVLNGAGRFVGWVADNSLSAPLFRIVVALYYLGRNAHPARIPLTDHAAVGSENSQVHKP